MWPYWSGGTGDNLLSFRQTLIWLLVLGASAAGYFTLRAILKPPVPETISLYGGNHTEEDVTGVSVTTEKTSVEIVFNGGRYWKKDTRKGSFSIPCKKKQIRTFFNGINAARLIKTVKIGGKNLDEWDLGDSAAKLVFSYADGSTRTIFIGADNPAGKGYFVRLDDVSDEVYLMSSQVMIAAEAVLFQIEEDRLFLAEKKDILSFSIDAPKGDTWEENRLTCELRSDGEWYLTRPLERRADKEAVENYIAAVAELEFESKDRLLFETVKDAVPDLTFTLALKGGESEIIDVYAGLSDLMGQEQYVVLNRRTGLIGRVYNMVFHTLNQSFVSFIWRRLYTGDPSRVRKITVKRGDRFLSFIKKVDGEWIVAEYFNANVNPRKMGIILDMLARFRVTEFVSDKVQDLEKYGLKYPVATLTVEEVIIDKVQSAVYYFGKQVPGTEEVYFRASDTNEIYTVHYQFLRNLSRPARFYVDTRILNARKDLIDRIKILRKDVSFKFYKSELEGWHLKEPLLTKHIDADKFERLLEGVANLNYREIPPPETIPEDAFYEENIDLILDVHSGHEKKFKPLEEELPEPERNFFFKFSKKKAPDNTVYVKNDLTNLVFTVSPETVDLLKSEFLDLSVFPEDMSNAVELTLSYTQKDRVLTAVKTRDAWSFKTQEPAAIDGEAVKSFISFLSELKGESVFLYRTDSKQRNELGFEKPAMKISLKNPGSDKEYTVSVSDRMDQNLNALVYREGEVYLLKISRSDSERLLVSPGYFMLK